jgi:hypothetical protein
MLTSVEFVVCQVSVVAWPLSTVLGFADNDAVGAGGGGGGGGGGGATFFLQAPNNSIALNTKTRVPHLFIECFTLSSKYMCARIVADFRIRGGAHGLPAADHSGIRKNALLPTPVRL